MIHQAHRVSEARRVRDQRIRDMPLADDRPRSLLSHKLESLAVIAFFAVPAAGYCFGTTGAVVTALLLIAGAVTEWVRDRRGM